MSAGRFLAVVLLALWALSSVASRAEEKAESSQEKAAKRAPLAPDLREVDSNVKLQRGDFVAVPIP